MTTSDSMGVSLPSRWQVAIGVPWKWSFLVGTPSATRSSWGSLNLAQEVPVWPSIVRREELVTESRRQQWLPRWWFRSCELVESQHGFTNHFLNNEMMFKGICWYHESEILSNTNRLCHPLVIFLAWYTPRSMQQICSWCIPSSGFCQFLSWWVG